MNRDEYRAKQDRLIKRCPHLFSGHVDRLECEAGWFQILEDLCCRLEGLYNKDGPTVVVAQIKEKFGGLRFYLESGHGDEGIAEAITRAAKQCDKTCEFCGAPGQLRQMRWMRTLCGEHFEHEQRRFRIMDLEDDVRDARREAERMREIHAGGNPAWVGPVFKWELESDAQG